MTGPTGILSPCPPLPTDVPGQATSPAQKLTEDMRRFRLLEDSARETAAGWAG